MKNEKKAILLIGGLCVGLGVAFAAAIQYQEKTATADAGKEYLESSGYKQVTGGEKKFFHSCGRVNTAREYTAVNEAGEKQQKTVCFSIYGKSVAPI